MDLADLHIFRSVVEAGGITRAAERLHRVQSNVTTRVRQLEDELGVQLFIRDGKRLHLSPAGSLLVGYAERLIALAEEARDAVQDKRPRGVLRLGSMESTASVRLPAVLAEIIRRYPELKLELRTGNTQMLAPAVLHGDLDAALVAEPVAPAPFDKAAIYDEELVIIAARGHPPIKAPQDVGPLAVLAFEHGCAFRKRLEDWFAHHGQMPDRIVEMSSYHAMLGCAVAGMGISLMPRIVLKTFPDAALLSVHPLPPEIARAQTLLIWRRGARSPKINALLEVLTDSTGTTGSQRVRKSRKAA
jgi:DNA-binding transcriptional LysR family regulator